MNTITDIAATATTRFDIDQTAAETIAREYLHQIEMYDGQEYDEDEIPTEVADFILGSIQAGQSTSGVTELDEISHAAQELDDAEQQVADRRDTLNRAILAAAAAGQTQKDIAAAADLSVPRIKQILSSMRAAQ